MKEGKGFGSGEVTGQEAATLDKAVEEGFPEKVAFT